MRQHDFKSFPANVSTWITALEIEGMSGEVKKVGVLNFGKRKNSIRVSIDGQVLIEESFPPSLGSHSIPIDAPFEESCKIEIRNDSKPTPIDRFTVSYVVEPPDEDIADQIVGDKEEGELAVRASEGRDSLERGRLYSRVVGFLFTNVGIVISIISILVTLVAIIVTVIQLLVIFGVIG